MAECIVVDTFALPRFAQAVPVEDDWSGVASAAERRRIQNRINARAYRQRKGRLRLEASLIQFPQSGPRPGDIIHASLPSSTKGIGFGFQHQPQARDDTTVYRLSTGDPLSDSLLTLVALNLQRALIANMHIFGLDGMDCKTKSPFSKGIWSDLPFNFWPTPLQMSKDHHPLFDLMPDAQLRHQLILFQETCGDELYFDLAGLCRTSTSDLGGLVVWGDAHLAENWEISEGFYRKYYQTVRDCTEMIGHSNRWREVRGEEPLIDFY